LPCIFAQLQPPVFIHPQQSRRRSASRRQTCNFTIAIFEMFIPIVETRMKQARQFSCLRVKPGKICAFVQVAVMTGQREIVRRIFSTVLSRNDMLDVKWLWLGILRQPAILATIFRALLDELSQPCVHLICF